MISPDAIFKVIAHLIDEGQQESALWVMDKLLADFPDNARLHNEMATLAYDQAETQKALSHFQQAVALDPENKEYLKNLADYYYVVEKEVEKALTHYEQVLEIDPNHIDSLILSGHLSITLHRYLQGQQYYQRTLDLDPQNKEIRRILEKTCRESPDQGDICPGAKARPVEYRSDPQLHKKTFPNNGNNQ